MDKLSGEARLLENALDFSYRLRLVLYAFLQVYDVEQWHLRRALEAYLARRSPDRTRYLLFIGHDPFAAHVYWVTHKYPHFAVEVIDTDPREIRFLNEIFHTLGARNVAFYQERRHHYPDHACYDYVAAIYRPSIDRIDYEAAYRALKPGGALMALFRVRDVGDVSAFREQVRQRLRAVGFRKIKFRFIYGKPASASFYLGSRPIRLLRVSLFFLPVVLLYYVLMLPVVAALNYADSHMVRSSGRVIMVRAVKPEQ